MTQPEGIDISISKGGATFHVHGVDAGAEGVHLAKGQVDGIYDSPIKSVWKSSAFKVGSKLVAYKRPHRDLNLGFHVINTDSSWEANNEAFLGIFSYYIDPFGSQDPTTIAVTTELSGTRYLDVLMYEEPEIHAELDPSMQGYANVLLKLRAGQPDWYEAAEVGTGGEISNPTDKPMYPFWVLPVGTHTIPDVETWSGPPGARTPGITHSVTVTISSAAGGAIMTPDKSHLPMRAINDTLVMGENPGKALTYPIPSYTQPINLGGSGQVIMPRRWSRPWGGELDLDGS